jgi:hypothetical protein
MILPSRHLSQDRALLTIGARILQRLHQPKTVSALWEELSAGSEGKPNSRFELGYNWYVLALDLLFLIGAIKLEEGLLTRQSS